MCANRLKHILKVKHAPQNSIKLDVYTARCAYINLWFVENTHTLPVAEFSVQA